MVEKAATAMEPREISRWELPVSVIVARGWGRNPYPICGSAG
jgi:hypothetical protein